MDDSIVSPAKAGNYSKGHKNRQIGFLNLSSDYIGNRIDLLTTFFRLITSTVIVLPSSKAKDSLKDALNLIYDPNLSDFNGRAINSKARQFHSGAVLFSRALNHFISRCWKVFGLRFVASALKQQPQKNFNQPMVCNLNKNVIIEWNSCCKGEEVPNDQRRTNERPLTGNGKNYFLSPEKMLFLEFSNEKHSTFVFTWFTIVTIKWNIHYLHKRKRCRGNIHSI